MYISMLIRATDKISLSSVKFPNNFQSKSNLSENTKILYNNNKYQYT